MFIPPKILFLCNISMFIVQIIDSNMSTIRILEPIAAEVAELHAMEDSEAGNGLSHATKFSFQLEKRNFTAIHLNAISRYKFLCIGIYFNYSDLPLCQRIYGEHGSEILELLRKNPAGNKQYFCSQYRIAFSQRLLW